jgi:hypothetical protein
MRTIRNLQLPWVPFNKWVKHDAQKARASYPRRYMTRIIIVMLIFSGLLIPAQANSDFRLCVSKVEKHHKNIWLEKVEGGKIRPFDYSVQVDVGPIIATDNSQGFEYPIDYSKSKYLIKIRNAETIVESFWLESALGARTEQCLWFKSFYETWSVWELSRSRHLCDCDE